MALTGSNNEQKIWNYLKAKGLNDYGAAGLMGNLYAESALIPTNLQNTYEKSLGYTDAAYTAAVDNGSYSNFVRDSAGYGLAQWTYWSRKQGLLEYAKAAGKSIGDLEMQLDFLMKELSGSYGSLLALLKSAASVKAASDAVLTQFERPADQSDSAKTRRASYGQTYYTKFAGTSAGDSSKGKEETKVKYSRQAVVDLALSWVGKKESDGSYKSIIDIYNTLPASQLPRGTKMLYGWAWCACTWSALAVKLGYTAIMPIEISCYYIIENAKKMGCWVENDAYVPSPGDAILYDWDDGSNYASTDNQNGADHIGTVVSVDKSAGTFVVVEGNMSNAVGKRTMRVNGRYIRGFITPKYDDNTVTQPTTPTATKTVEELAKEVLAGKWGNGDARKQALTEAGYDYAAVQAKVNELVKAGSGTAKKEIKVGDIVNFTGDTHYTNANAATGKGCDPGKAKVPQIYMLGKSKHPYHLVREVGGGSTVWGWVDAEDIDGAETAGDAGFQKYNVRVTISDLNIRTGPGTNYAKTGKFTGPGTFTIVEESAGKGSDKGWGKLLSGAGWIALDYATKV